MNMIHAFNRTMDYIETVLDDEIDDKEIYKLSSYSYPMFSRLFSILTGITLSEYIRSRKLTEAAIELRTTKIKIIELAFKYGYESSDAFSAAFKNFHGFSPSEVRNGKQFKLVSRIQLALSIKGGRSMNIKIEKKKGFVVAGINKENIPSSLCTSTWQELHSKYHHEDFLKIGNGQSIGVCHDVKDPNKINYFAGYICDNLPLAKEMGLDVLEVDSAEYAVVELTGAVPDCIHQGWKYVMEVFFPEHGYMHSGSPDFEYYYDGDMQSSDYKMELWIPVVKV